jgi:Cd2+/Zn2+-exporting ATPase
MWALQWAAQEPIWALETADIALMGDDLGKLPFAVGLGRATRAVVFQNLGIALVVIMLLMVTSVFSVVHIGLAIIFHEGSTLFVVANSLRLLAYQGT